MILVEPKERVGNEKVLHFVAAVVVNQSAPVGVSALARIRVLVQMRAVELREAVGVTGKMRGRPIENYADARDVAAVDEFHELRGRAKAAGDGVVAERLIAPGTVEGMLHDGEQLDVRVAQLFHVGNELVGYFAVGEPAVAFLGNAAPGAEMDFVDGQRRLEPVFLGATRHPRRVSPGIVVKARDDRTGVRPELGAKAVGIGFERQDRTIRRDDLVFVNRAFVELGREEFPNAGGAARAHQVHAAVPAIEVADDADAARARRPDGKVHAAHAF